MEYRSLQPMTVNYEELRTLRRHLHAHPEVSGTEQQTAKRVVEWLQKCSASNIEVGIGGHGIVATWDSGQPGKTLMFRAELDALPIQEINDFEHRSRIEGVSHKCGHDGHATILCGLAKNLSIHPPSSGKVHLLFQPAEENGEGAKAMLADEKFKNYAPDYVFALHNLPSYALGEVVVKGGTFTAAVNSIIISLQGKTSHAAEPEHGLNPALALSQILMESLALAHNHPEDEDMKVVTPVYVHMGELAYGISAGSAEVHLTLRCWNDENLRKLESDVETISMDIAKTEGLEVSFKYTQSFHANQNNSEAVAYVSESAAVQKMALIERDFPFKWGEDFGLFTAKYKGCMFGLGSGEKLPALHNPDYDYPDDLTEYGVKIFSGIMEEIAKEN